MQTNPTTTLLPELDYRWVFLASLLLSVWLIAIDPLINRDAIIYLRSADAYLSQGFSASQDIFSRPLLPICMALIHQFTGLSLLYAGLLLTSLSYAVLCVTFVATCYTLGGDRRVQWLAALIILSHPILNHSRSAIMRDPMYWALLLLAFREFLLYLRWHSLKHQLRWFCFIFAAVLFRFEGLFFAVLAPFSLLFTRSLEHRYKHCVRLLLPQLIALAALLTAIAVYSHHQQPDAQLFPAITKYIDRLMALPEKFATVAAQSAEPLLRFSAINDYQIAAVFGLLGVLLLNIIRALTRPWLLALTWGARSGIFKQLRDDDRRVLNTHIAICTLYLVLFMLINRFMLERYASQLVLFALLYLPFVLNQLISSSRIKKWLAFVLLLGMTIDTLHTSDYKKAFINQATQWLRNQTPSNSTLLTNEKYIAYFSEREIDWPVALGYGFETFELLAQEAIWRDKDYIAVYLKSSDEQAWAKFLQQHGLVELRSFKGRDRGRVAIVKLKASQTRVAAP